MNVEGPALRCPSSFPKDASIVLTGPRGNGKSTLAIIAGLMLRRRVIDVDDLFVATIGLSKAAFRKKMSGENYHKGKIEATLALLTRYDKDCVIACGECIVAEQCRAFMTAYRRTHPVINVMRPIDDIEDYVGVEEKGKMHQWMYNIHATYLRISNFEFFNLPEGWKETDERCPAQERLESILPQRVIPQKRVQTLQKTKTALARFLQAALGHNAASLSHTIFPALYPPLLERRLYSTAVCISVTAAAHEGIDISQVSVGADAVEFVLDARDPECKALVASGTVGQLVAESRRFLAVPIIYHVHLPHPKIKDWHSYFDLLYEGLRFAADYLTVNLDAPDAEISSLISKRGCTTVIGHQENPSGPAPFWQSPEPLNQYTRAMRLGCGAVRLVKPCETMAENYWCMTFVDKINTTPDNIPVIAYNTGSLGRLSQICNARLSPVLNSPKLKSSPDPSVWSLTSVTIDDRWKSLFALNVLNPLQFFVVGSTVRNSLSPAMHNAAFQALGMPHVYGVCETTSLEELRRLFQHFEFGGASVSLPFKKEILALVSKLSPSAEVIGAVNTIIPIRKLPENQDLSDLRPKEHLHRDGPVAMLYGDNTDWIGICACAVRSISPANSVNLDTAGLVIGAGGMARAAVYCLLYLGVRNICIFNRTVANAHALANHFEAVFASFVQRKSHSSPSPGDNPRRGLRIRVLDSIDVSWPSDLSQPSIVICAIKAYDRQQSGAPPFRMPESWMENPTGGIVIEVGYLECLSGHVN
jgi:shikimate kinase